MTEDKADRILSIAEKWGLPTLLLLGLSYVGYTAVLRPLAESYRATIERVGQEVIDNDADDAERVKQITEALKSLENKIDQALSRVRE